ncbi:nucleotide disphospho-sugar-binding domain-containing protein [Streptomyces sp. P1-3]|uniref:nucleotide disphospho-sugar-binding domain-containing protein n=1 Tax=Streptomyces sp. P1-3 TaxID=3421658 RepID=UPI003D36C8CD
MRVLFTTRSAGGRLAPLLPLARSFVAAGHGVRVAVPPGCAEPVARAGLLAVLVGPQIAAAAPRGATPVAMPGLPGVWPANWPLHPASLTGAQHAVLRATAGARLRAAEAMAPDLVSFARCWEPDLVVHDATSYAGIVAAAVLGAPAISQLSGSAAIIRLDRHRLDGPPLPGLARLLERYGADPAREPDLWLDPCPPSVALPSAERRLRVRFVPPPLDTATVARLRHMAGRYDRAPGAGPAWPRGTAPGASRDGSPAGSRGDARTRDPGGPPGRAASGRASDGVVRRAFVGPRVCVAWDDPAGLPEPVRSAVRQVEARGIRIIRTGSAAGPLHVLLPGCRAVLHQGNGGAALAAALTGVPQLIVPPRPEQRLNAAQLARVGVARVWTPPGGGTPRPPGARAPARAVQSARAETRLIDNLFALVEQPRYAAAAERLRGEMLAMPGPDDAVVRLASAVS